MIDQISGTFFSRSPKCQPCGIFLELEILEAVQLGLLCFCFMDQFVFFKTNENYSPIIKSKFVRQTNFFLQKNLHYTCWVQKPTLNFMNLYKLYNNYQIVLQTRKFLILANDYYFKLLVNCYPHKISIKISIKLETKPLKSFTII